MAKNIHKESLVNVRSHCKIFLIKGTRKNN